MANSEIITLVYIRQATTTTKNVGLRAKLAARPPGILPVLPMASPPLGVSTVAERAQRAATSENTCK